MKIIIKESICNSGDDFQDSHGKRSISYPVNWRDKKYGNIDALSHIRYSEKIRNLIKGYTIFNIDLLFVLDKCGNIGWDRNYFICG